MKDIFLSFVFVLLFASGTQATVRTVSNTTSSPGEFTDIQTAITASAPYDTILVSGSSSAYADIDIDKPLTLIGAGYHGDANETTQIGKISLKKGTLDASNSKIIGFDITGTSQGLYFYANATLSNIVFERCSIRRIDFSSLGSCTDIYVINCFLHDGKLSVNANNTSNLYYINNVMEAFRFQGGSYVLDPGLILEHNLILDLEGGALTTLFYQLNKAVISNNIFLAADPSGCSQCEFYNNITYLCNSNDIPYGDNTGSGNFTSQDPKFVYYDWSTHPNFSYNSNYHLNTGSPGLLAATDGTDIGIFGGNYPYEVGAYPNIPYLSALNLSASSVGIYEPLDFSFTAVHDINMVSAEYFIDTDPGVGGGSSITVVPSASLDITETADISSATTATHYLYVRAKDEAGKWGHWKREVFTKESKTLSININNANASCNGICDGTAGVEITSGNGNYTFAWSDDNYIDLGETTQNITGLCPGNYRVTVTDGTGQEDSLAFSILEPDPIIITETISGDTCGYAEGSISVSVSNNMAGASFTFVWSTGSTTSWISSLTTGSYSVSVTDQNGCIATEQYTLAGSSTAFSLSVSTVASDCAQSTGGATANAAGGTAPYAYIWSDGETSATLTYHPSGTYAVTVSDVNGCQLIDIAAISDLGAPQITIESTTNVSCHSYTDGAIDISVSNGTPPYVFDWSNSESTEDIDGLGAGNYEIIVMDNDGCQGTANIAISQPEALSLSFASVDANCGNADGSATVTVNGGTAPFTYSWETGGSSDTETGLAAGIYFLTVTDANSCEIFSAAAISEAGAANITVNNITEGSCGSSDASIDISVDETTVEYLWSNGTTTQDLSGVSPGDYSVVVTNTSNSCEAIEYISIPAILPAKPSICIVTVDTTSEKNLVVWEKSGQQGIAYYSIYRESSSAGDYEFLGSVNYDETSIFTDLTSNPFAQPYRYRLTAVDSCGNESYPSNYHQTLLLGVSEQLPQGYHLDWQDHYEGFAFTSYGIWRGTSTGDLQQIATVSSNFTSYIDESPVAGTLFYRVAAIKTGNPCDPTNGAKLQSGPYSNSFSNLDDNGVADPCVNYPVSTGSISGNNTGIVNDTITYSVVNTAGSNYSWTVDGGTIISGQNSNEISVHWTASGNGIVEVEETNQEGCIGTPVSHAVTISTGIEEYNSLYTLRLYPNPAKDKLNLVFESKKNGIALVKIIDARGRIVIEDNIESGQSTNKTLNVGHLDAGVYEVQVVFEENVTHRKIVLE